MKTRIILGALMLVILTFLFVLDHWRESRIAVSAVAVLIGCAGWLEFAKISRVWGQADGSLTSVVVGLLGTAYFLLVPFWSDNSVDWMSIGLAGVIFGAFLPALLSGEHERGLRLVQVTVLGVLLWGFLFSFTLRIYHHSNGISLGVFFLLGAKGNDIVAYFVGRAVGKHTFLKVSPKKTLEGCGGAIVFSVLWFIGLRLVSPDVVFGWPLLILLGIIFSVMTQAGDLAESLLKRAFGVKDSASLLPEFGGVLDLIDSTLFSGVFFWCVVEAFLG